METTALLKELLTMFISPLICKHFVIKEIKQGVDRIDLRMEELPDLVPADLLGKEVVLDGFCNELELQSMSAHDRAVFLHIFRRRWKEKGTDKHYSNTYDLHPPGVKATHEFAAFLKEEFRCTPEQYYAYIRSLHNLD